MEPVYLTAAEGEISLPCDERKKKEPRSNAKMMRDYRKRVKADPIKYQKYLEQERQRNNRRKRRKRNELKELEEQLILNDTGQILQTEMTGIQCKTEPLDESPVTYNTGTIAETVLKSPIENKTEFKVKPLLHVGNAPTVRNNPVQTALPVGQTDRNNIIKIRTSLPGDLKQAFNIKIVDSGNLITTATEKKLTTANPSSAKRCCIVEPVNTGRTTTITNTALNTENQIPEKRRCIVEPTPCVRPDTKPLESAKCSTVKETLSNIKQVVAVVPPSPPLISQDFKITLITLDEVPFRPRISVIRDRTRTITAKTGNDLSTANLMDSPVTNNIGSRVYGTDSSQDGDIEDVTPAARLIDLTDDVSDGDSSTCIPAFADLTNQPVNVNGITSTTNTNVVQSEEENSNKLNYIDSFMGFVSKGESETNKQRLVSKGMMWNRYS